MGISGLPLKMGAESTLMVEDNINTELYPIAEQASRIIEYMGRTPNWIIETDPIFAASGRTRICPASRNGQTCLGPAWHLEEQGFSYRTVASPISR